MEDDAYNIIKQLGFHLYACSKEVIRAYRPYLDGIGLTYTQYLTMQVLWEHNVMNVKAIGQYLYLDSGTLTPVLKKLEARGLVERKRSEQDERKLIVELTKEGRELERKSREFTEKLKTKVTLSNGEIIEFQRMLFHILNDLNPEATDYSIDIPS